MGQADSEKCISTDGEHLVFIREYRRKHAHFLPVSLNEAFQQGFNRDLKDYSTEMSLQGRWECVFVPLLYFPKQLQPHSSKLENMWWASSN